MSIEPALVSLPHSVKGLEQPPESGTVINVMYPRVQQWGVIHELYSSLVRDLSEAFSWLHQLTCPELSILDKNEMRFILGIRESGNFFNNVNHHLDSGMSGDR